MFRINQNKGQATARAPLIAGQAAAELAVFGAIVIFLLGTIIRSSVGNSYTQNQNFKAMRMALLESWNSSKASQGLGAVANTAHNSASILFVEDRLSPDFTKYGDLDRNPFIAQGSGSFTYELLYPLDVDEAASNVPIMDVYINGQYFPFTTAGYRVENLDRQNYINQCGGSSYQSTSAAQTQCLVSNPPQQCEQAAYTQCVINQCLRNAREWVGGTVAANQFETVIPQPPNTILSPATDATMASNSTAIFNELVTLGIVTQVSSSGGTPQGIINPALITPTMPSAFGTWLEGAYPGTGQAQIDQVQNTLLNNKTAYKLFYSMVPNTEGGSGTQFSVNAPTCGNHPCKDGELSTDRTLGNLTGADLMYDLQRTNVPTLTVPTNLRPYIAWEWSATAGTTPTLIGLDTTNNQYPSYDVDGRLKEVTIYAINQGTSSTDPSVQVGIEDFQAGDIDSSWDANSCGPKPGLQAGSDIYTFTQDGTYLQIKEGQLYNPETGQEVRSINQRNSIDLVQRTIQLSNNTGRFCTSGQTTPPPYVQNCANGTCTACTGSSCVTNPVELCVNGSSPTNNCFSGSNIAMTCYDTTHHIIYVRSRLLNQGGSLWMTNAAGQLQVQ